MTIDLATISSGIQAYGQEQYQAGYASRDGELTQLTQENLALRQVLAPFLKVPFGVNIHSTFRKSVYGDLTAVGQAVLASGATFVRDRISSMPNHPQRALWRALNDSGIKVLALVGDIAGTENRLGLAQALVDMADCLVGVEGLNEPEKTPGWVPKVSDHQRWLWATVKNQPALAHLPVLSPTLRDRNPNLARDWGVLLGAIDGFYDVVALHLYPTEDPGLDEAYLTSRTSLLPATAKGKPVAVTEVGWNTAAPTVGGGLKVTPEEQAARLVAGLKMLHSHGITGYVYELLDDPFPTDDYQSYWGINACSQLASTTWSPKPAVAALAQMAAGDWAQ